MSKETPFGYEYNDSISIETNSSEGSYCTGGGTPIEDD